MWGYVELFHAEQPLLCKIPMSVMQGEKKDL